MGSNIHSPRVMFNGNPLGKWKLFRCDMVLDYRGNCGSGSAV
jgi:hypothetical protein